MESSSGDRDQYPMDNDYQWLHGRVDAGNDENVHLVESVPVQLPAKEELQQRNLINVSREGTPFTEPSVPECPLPGMWSGSTSFFFFVGGQNIYAFLPHHQVYQISEYEHHD